MGWGLWRGRGQERGFTAAIIFASTSRKTAAGGGEQHGVKPGPGKVLGALGSGERRMRLEGRGQEGKPRLDFSAREFELEPASTFLPENSWNEPQVQTWPDVCTALVPIRASLLIARVWQVGRPRAAESRAGAACRRVGILAFLCAFCSRDLPACQL